jgi:hypothetical protein
MPSEPRAFARAPTVVSAEQLAGGGAVGLTFGFLLLERGRVVEVEDQA